MNHLTDQLEEYISSNSPNENIVKVRKNALAKFLEYGFPQSSLENYRFTNLSKLNKVKFDLPKNISKKENFNDLSNEYPVLQFIDGQFSKELSSLPDFISIESVLNKEENFQPSHAVKYDSSSNPFAYLNSAFLNIGYVIKITKSSDLPIIIESKMTEKSENLMSHPKFIIKSSNNVDAIIYESYLGENAFYLNNVSTEFIIGNNSHIKHYRSQLESNRAYHIANSNYNISKDASIHSTQIVLGSHLHRHDINVTLEGKNANIDLNGLCLIKNTQHFDHNIIFDHAREHVTSKMLFKYILSDRSTGVFNGRALVREDSQKIDSIQTNNNLILSDSSIMNSNPQLEIYADDVKCTHGSTTGQLDKDALFYLRSRGLDIFEAKSILINGFANEIIDQMSNITFKSTFTKYLDQWLKNINDRSNI